MTHWLSWVAVGLLLGLGGVLALANPFAASLAVEALVGWVFLIGGALQLYVAYKAVGMGGRLSAGLWGVLGLVTGISLLADPFGGLISLTLLLGIVFAISGIARLVLAWALRDTLFFWVLLLSGALSVLLGGMVMANLMEAATTLLGVILAIELISDGIGAIAYGLMLRSRGN